MELDLKLSGGMIIDGSGQGRFRADIGIKDELISKVGDLKDVKALEEYDITGLTVAPGFIDIHSHSDLSVLVNPKATGKIYQGVTTEVLGNCGSSAAPMARQAVDSVRSSAMKYNLELSWRDMAGYFKEINTQGCAVNVVSLVGHGLLRKSIMGDDISRPTVDQLEEMKELLTTAMEQGAWGISTGLIYPPSSYAQTKELIELAKVVSEYGGIYATHLRDEGDRLITAVKEAIKIGKEAQVSVQLSHHKANGKKNWGKVKQTLQLITEANQIGLDIDCDVYPYLATSTGLSALLPSRVKEGGSQKVIQRLNDEKVVEQIKEYWEEERKEKESWEKILIAEVDKEYNKYLEGKSVAEIAKEKGNDPAEVVIDLLINEELKVSMVKFSICKEDLERVLTFPKSMIGSDALTRSKDGILNQGKPHPRAYGTFPKVINQFVKKEKVITLEEAIKKMTYLPAKKLALTDRGRIDEGLKADLVIFDLNELKDKATYQNPHQYAQGVKYSLVNGEFIIKDSKHTSKLPGKVLKNRHK
ncbi:N-acyl-D-amino-acid deacylase family protein [Selenihalanaerobacter shriftii]|uniref:N-acyl-D-amino-acid deacylase n=1 Tax=Selenihalanaerobacter shriftii TaxID=142842 RepID=A0A1T4N6F0_9FIRM|nr:D-aminoacylase [Selenihalanaerobacter shriftii]SJZ74428.1 N-acyl-D-amino-acid deacylase [Selenihalanaerobacter shriftii]